MKQQSYENSRRRGNSNTTSARTANNSAGFQAAQ